MKRRGRHIRRLRPRGWHGDGVNCPCCGWDCAQVSRAEERRVAIDDQDWTEIWQAFDKTMDAVQNAVRKSREL